MSQAQAPMPLEGLRVLDLSRLIAGGVIGTLFADFGADVVKVEAPGTGDPLRAWSVKGSELWWKVYARGKRSMSLDLSREEGRQILLDILPGFDVLIEGFVPGKLESWGLSPERMLEVHPGLVVVRTSGWGQTGTYRDRPGFGTLIEGMSGFAHMTGTPEGPPTLPPLPLADMVTALYGTAATMFALFHRVTKSGKGQVIDLSIYEPLISILGPAAAEYQHFSVVPERRGNRAPTNAPRNAYRCSDGKWLALSAATQAMTEKTLRAVDRPELIADPRFLTNADRIRNVAALDEAIEAVVGGRTLDENLASFHAHGVTAAPIYDIVQLLDDPHVKDRDVIVEVADPDHGTVKMHNVIPRLSGTPGRIRSTGPRLGEHGLAVLEEAGFSPERVRQAREEGLV